MKNYFILKTASSSLILRSLIWHCNNFTNYISVKVIQFIEQINEPNNYAFSQLLPLPPPHPPSLVKEINLRALYSYISTFDRDRVSKRCKIGFSYSRYKKWRDLLCSCLSWDCRQLQFPGKIERNDDLNQTSFDTSSQFVRIFIQIKICPVSCKHEDQRARHPTPKIIGHL